MFETIFFRINMADTAAAVVNGALKDQVNGQQNDHMNGQVNGHMNGQVNGHMNGQANGHMNGHMTGTGDSSHSPKNKKAKIVRYLVLIDSTITDDIIK